MILSEEQLKKYTCKLEKDFIDLYYKDKKKNKLDTNEMLNFLLNYNEVKDKSKQYFYFMCMKTFDDIPKELQRKYEIKFGLINCGKEIYNSFGCNHSNLLLNCNNISYSFGCYKCKFSYSLLYCTEQRHESLMAFNKKITSERFLELIKMAPEELKQTPEFDERIYTHINKLIQYIYRLK